MRRLIIFYFSLLSLLIFSNGNLYAQASTTGHIFAEIITVFAASETSQMSFGRFAPGVQGGEIILTPQSTVSVMGSVFKGPGTHNAASFYVTGDTDAAFSISLPSEEILLRHIGTEKTMVIKDWMSNPSPGIGTGMLQNGFQVVYVGATLMVGTLNDNPVGIYTGSYTITFDFN
ncbi:MAG: DUF4402 domain-containing protein [Bacteroidia bacterium]|nr:MAG: DUF4402 domain-containing protein [Bacteroidia bacterium]